MEKENLRTFDTRLPSSPGAEEILDNFADLFAYLQHRLLADISSGKTPGELKNDYLVAFGITARQFNSLRVAVEGKIASIKKSLPTLIVGIKERVVSLTKKIKRLIKTKAPSGLIHQKKRQLGNLEHKLENTTQDYKNGTIRCCFGGKKLFNAQFALEENGHGSHEEWRKNWKKARSSELFFLGSKDEASGNQTCTVTLQPDQTIQLRIRLPNALAKYGKYLILSGITFKYGKKELYSVLTSETVQAITWRFKRDKKGWRIFASFDVQPAACTSQQNMGVIGLDINVDHLALVETDRFGNPVSNETIPYNLYGKSTDQAKAIIGDATAAAVAFAERTNKPLVFEKLDFQKKKTRLRETNRVSYARMLSSFSYGSIITHLKSRASKKGVLTAQVNPAYTSIIGRIKYAKRYGLSIHLAAALSIGRRYLCFSEKAPSTFSEIPDGKDGHVTLPLPVRNRGKHVWSFWSASSKKLQAALAAHFRTAKSRSKSSLKPAFETEPFSDVVGETPAREPSELLFA